MPLLHIGPRPPGVRAKIAKTSGFIRSPQNAPRDFRENLGFCRVAMAQHEQVQSAGQRALQHVC